MSSPQALSKKTHIKLFFKAIFWYIVGTFFGTFMVFLSIFAAILQGKIMSFWDKISAKELMLLFVCLMGGAAADVACSEHFEWPKQAVALMAGIILLLILGFIYYPGAPEPKNEDLVYYITVAYFIISFLFCVFLKFVLFEKESILALNAKQ